MLWERLNPDVRTDDARGPSAAAADDALIAYLVGTVHSATGPLATSTALALLVALAAYEVTDAPVFLAHALAQIVIGFGRFARLGLYKAAERTGLTKRDVVAHDRASAFWSALYALGLGLICCELTARPEESDAFALALATCAGYTLAYIQNYPFSKIKIDRKFVENIHSDRVSSAIVASVCVLAARIDMKVVAEGVETQAQQRALIELGVDFAQGYLYGRPAPMAKATPQQQLAVFPEKFAEARRSG